MNNNSDNVIIKLVPDKKVDTVTALKLTEFQIAGMEKEKYLLIVDKALTVFPCKL